MVEFTRADFFKEMEAQGISKDRAESMWVDGILNKEVILGLANNNITVYLQMATKRRRLHFEDSPEPEPEDVVESQAAASHTTEDVNSTGANQVLMPTPKAQPGNNQVAAESIDPLPSSGDDITAGAAAVPEEGVPLTAPALEDGVPLTAPALEPTVSAPHLPTLEGLSSDSDFENRAPRSLFEQMFRLCNSEREEESQAWE